MSAPEAPALKSYIWGHDRAITSAHNARTLDNAVPYLLPYLQSLAPSFTFLDVGCGPGSISRDVARRFPQAHVLGIDPSPKVIQLAQDETQAEGLPNIVFAVGEASTLSTLQIDGFDGHISGAFDVVHTHQVLQHVNDPLTVLKSMRAAAKPDGGLVACREVDWGMITLYPDAEGVRFWKDIWERVARSKGNDPDVGRKMLSLALRAGWTRDQIDASLGSWLFSTPDERRRWQEDQAGRLHDQSELANCAAMNGWINGSDDVQRMKDGWQTWADAEDGWFALPCPQIVCRRG